MPASRGEGGPHWHPKPDFKSRNFELNILPSQPKTHEDIRNWLEDIGASALAAANQFVDPDTAAEVYDDMALRVYEDVKSGYLPLEGAVLRQQYKELGIARSFCYLSYEDGSNELKIS